MLRVLKNGILKNIHIGHEPESLLNDDCMRMPMSMPNTLNKYRVKCVVIWSLSVQP